MARVVIPVLSVVPNDTDEVDLYAGGVALDDGGDGYTLLNPNGKVVLLAILDESTDVTVKVVAVDDPYGRGGGGDGDLTHVLSTALGEFRTLVIGRFTPQMFNQSGVSRVVNVDVTGLTGTGLLVALQL